MAKNYTSHFKEQTSATSGEAPVYLLEITHPQIEDAVRVVNDTQDFRLKANPGAYLDMPESVDDGAEIIVDYDFTAAESIVAQIGSDVSTLTVSRASANATRFNSVGAMETLAIDAPAFDYHPITLASRGLRLEGARTNSIRNSTMAGAAAPSTEPTNWATAGSFSGTLARTITGVGVENGMNYVEYTLSGTPASSGSVGHYFEMTAAGVLAQEWTGSGYFKAVGTPVGVTTASLLLQERDAGGVNLAQTAVAFSAVVTVPTRASATRVLNQATVATVWIGYAISYTNAVAVNITYRIYCPQLEQGSSASSFIPTSTVAVARAIDRAFDTAIGWFNVIGGTLVVEFECEQIDSTFRRIVSFNGGSSAEEIYAGISSNLGRVFVVDGSVSQAGLSLGTLAAGINRIALGYAENDFVGALNGGAVSTDVAGTLPTVTRMDLGSVNGGGTANVWIRRVTYFANKLANATTGTISGGFENYESEFIACAFRVQFPDDVANMMPRVPIAIDNVGRELTQWLEASNGGKGAQFRIMQVMRDTPEVIEQEYSMTLLSVKQNVLEVSGQLGYENFLDRPCLPALYTPSRSPGLF